MISCIYFNMFFFCMSNGIICYDLMHYFSIYVFILCPMQMQSRPIVKLIYIICISGYLCNILCILFATITCIYFSIYVFFVQCPMQRPIYSKANIYIYIYNIAYMVWLFYIFFLNLIYNQILKILVSMRLLITFVFLKV